MASNYFISSHLHVHVSIFIPMFSAPVHPTHNNKIVSYKTHPFINI